MLGLQGSEQRLEDTAELQNAAPRPPGAIIPLLHTNAHAETEDSGLGFGTEKPPSPLAGLGARIIASCSRVMKEVSAPEMMALDGAGETVGRIQMPEHGQSRLDPERPVGWESRKTYAMKIANGFFDRYLSGSVILDIGYKGGNDDAVPIVPQAIGIDLDYPGYDGATLPFPDESQDAIYTSHCLEHISDYKQAIREWFRVLKPGGHLVIIVPHQYLFERRHELPSRLPGHLRFYTPASLLQQIEEILEPNSYRVRHLVDNDFGFDYSILPWEDPHHVVGCYEIELVLEKIQPPYWTIYRDNKYSAADFRSNVLPVAHPVFFIETDFSVTDACIVYGPYVRLPLGTQDATFHVKALGLGDQELASPITFDVAQDRIRIASVDVVGRDGANLLRSEKVAVQFRNNTPDSFFEFRMFTAGRPFHGTFAFFGVSLRRL